MSRPIMGPAPCMGCGALVDLRQQGWCDRGTLQRHRCGDGPGAMLNMAHPAEPAEPVWVRAGAWLIILLAVLFGAAFLGSEVARIAHGLGLL